MTGADGILVASTLSLRLTTIRPHTEKRSTPEGIGAANQISI